MMIATATGASASEQDTACPTRDFDMSTYSGPLNEAEKGGLLLALNDEVHAWANYDQGIADHGDVRPFTNIRQSEATHYGALAELFDAYDMPVPDNPWPGNVPTFDSVTDACAAAAGAELANTDLCDEIFDMTEREDILTVYESLQRASEENHLPACGVTPRGRVPLLATGTELRRGSTGVRYAEAQMRLHPGRMR